MSYVTRSSAYLRHTSSHVCLKLTDKPGRMEHGMAVNGRPPFEGPACPSNSRQRAYMSVFCVPCEESALLCMTDEVKLTYERLD